MKKLFFLSLLTGLCIGANAQVKTDITDLNCYNKWSVKFEERGAEEIKDGSYTDVIISFRQGAKADCYTGKVEVMGGQVVHLYTETVDGHYTEVKKSWKPGSEKDITIVNGISKTMITIHNELINVIWPNKIKPKKAALKRAPEPADD